MKYLYLFIVLVFFIGCNDNKPTSAPAVTTANKAALNEEGAHLFKIHCNQCHMPAKDFAAPALAGVEKRWASKELLYAYIKNSAEVIKTDKYAADLFEKWKQAPMLAFPQLSNTDIDAILEYCNQVAVQ
ncbi:MAG: cytochrome c [Rhizobacter sp.]|nr:cytochrome c [Ferruginibacter sp.]